MVGLPLDGEERCAVGGCRVLLPLGLLPPSCTLPSRLRCTAVTGPLPLPCSVATLGERCAHAPTVGVRAEQDREPFQVASLRLTSSCRRLLAALHVLGSTPQPCLPVSWTLHHHHHALPHYDRVAHTLVSIHSPLYFVPSSPLRHEQAAYHRSSLPPSPSRLPHLCRGTAAPPPHTFPLPVSFTAASFIWDTQHVASSSYC